MFWKKSGKLKAIEKAREIYIEHGLTAGFDTVEFAEKLGFKIRKVSKATSKEIFKSDKDFAGAIDYQKDIIYINEDDCLERRRFTVAHELGHWFLHKSEDGGSVDFRDGNSTPKEVEANAFASELLMPKLEVKKFINDMNGKSFYLSEFAGKFKVSKQASIYKLKEVGFNIE